MSTQDPAILGSMTNLVRVWAWKNKEVPDDFTSKATVTSASRQPVVYASVDLERCERATRRIDTPLMPDQDVDAAPWPTKDIYALLPMAAPEFPKAPDTEITKLPGGQEAVACAQCSGAGAVACRRCEGGRIACPRCGGAMRTTCIDCGGTGTHLGVSGRMIQCRTCQSSGTVLCDRCAQAGRVTCPTCHGKGLLPCEPCAGFGKILRVWELRETRYTDHRHRPQIADLWGADWDAAFEQAGVVVERVYRIDQQPPSVVLDPIAPPALQDLMESLLENALKAHAAACHNGHATDRIVGVRVGLRALYAYDVQIDYGGDSYRVLIVGGETIMPCKLPKARHGAVAYGAGLIKRYLHALQTDEISGPQEAFIRAVNTGQAHISDEACLLPQVAARLETQIDVTEEGYRCYVCDKCGDNGPLTVALDVRFDLNHADQRMLYATIDLGEAFRDRFARLLAACHELPIGRLAVVDATDGSERLHLVDCRPYATCSAAQYAIVLQFLACVARQLGGPVMITPLE